jgi:hypothetical protein
MDNISSATNNTITQTAAGSQTYVKNIKSLNVSSTWPMDMNDSELCLLDTTFCDRDCIVSHLSRESDTNSGGCARKQSLSPQQPAQEST